MESCHNSDAESVSEAELSQNQLQYSHHNGFTCISDSDDNQNQSTVESASHRSSSPQYVSLSPWLLARSSSEPQRKCQSYRSPQRQLSEPDQRRKHGITFVDQTDQQSRCLDLPRDTPDRLTETCVGNTDQHHSCTANRHIDGTGRRQSSPDPHFTRADIQSRDSNSSVDITTNRYANMHDSRADDRNQHNLSTTQSVDVPCRRQCSLEPPVTSNLHYSDIPVNSTGQHTYDQASLVGNLDQHPCNIGSSVSIHPREKCGCCLNFPSRHCRNESRHVDTHNYLQKHKGGDNVSYQYQCHQPVNSVSGLAQRHDLTDTEYQNDQSYASKSTYDANSHRTHNTDTSYNHTGRPRSPFPYFSMPTRRSHIQSRPYCSLNRRQSQRYSSADNSPVRRDLNQSNKSSPDSRGRLRSRNCSM